MAKKFQHDWGFMGNSKYGDLAHCEVKTCGKWRLDDGKPFSLSWDEYQGMHNRGEIDANECLEQTNLFLVKPSSHKGIEDLPH